MHPRYDVVIVGLGSMGSAAAYHLARRGVRVLGIDGLRPPHTRGSHGGLTRMTRMAYAEHPGYVPLLRRAYELWRELEEESGSELLHVTGGVYIGPESSEYIQGAVRAARLHGLEHEVLSSGGIADRYPWFRTEGDAVAFYDAGGGFLYPHRVIDAHLRLARDRGAELRMGEPVIGWDADARGARVRTGVGTYLADRLILAGGAWMPKLLGAPPESAPALKLSVTRQTLTWVEPPDPRPFELGRFPVWAYTLDGRKVFYGFPVTPDGAGGRGLKLAHHSPFAAVDPDTDPRTARVEEAEPALEFLRRCMPSAAGRVADVQVCLYTNTPDGHFVVDFHPAHTEAKNVVVASPCSGHGFKFAAVIGEVLAELAVDGVTGREIGFLSAVRRVKR